jgi:hypothetical protein
LLNNNKEKLLYIGHFFHEKTKSANFFTKILEKNYLIKKNYFGQYQINKVKKYKNIIFCQNFPSVYELIHLKNSKIVWVPMYDSLSNLDPNVWRICSFFPNIKILSFSKKINELCIKNNLSYFYLRFFLKPIKNTNLLKKKIKILFWYRGQIKFNDWINYVNLNEIERIYYYQLIDPFYKKENFTKKEIIKYKLRIIKGSFRSSKKKFIKLVKQCDVFVAPRKKEGIGMSFIEAISRSKYILAFNNSTMKDYIKNKKIGYLINKNNFSKINPNYIKNYSDYRFKYAVKIYKEWTIKKKKILEIFNFKNIEMNSIYSFKFLILFTLNLFFENKNNLKKSIRFFLNIKYKKL